MDQARIQILPDIYRGQVLQFGLVFSNLLNTKGGQSLHMEGSETSRTNKSLFRYFACILIQYLW